MQPLQTNTPDGVENFEQDTHLYIEDFEKDDFVYFLNDFGFAINIKAQSLLLFQKEGRFWVTDTFPLSHLHSATETVLEADELYFLNQSGGARGIGQAIGTGIRNSIEKSKANKGTGITLHFRSTNCPKIFMNVTNHDERLRLAEAFRQVLNDGKLQTPYRVIPKDVREEFTPLSQEEIDQLDADAYRQEVRATRTKFGMRDYLVILTLCAIATISTWAIGQSYDVNLTRSEILICLGSSAILAWIFLVAIKAVLFWVWEFKHPDELIR